MKQKITLKLLLCFLFFLSEQSFSQTYEAENATLSNGADIRNSTSASGDKYVYMGEGNILFSVQVQDAGAYNLKICFSQTYDGYKAQNVAVNGTTAGAVPFLRTGPGPNPVFEETKTIISLNAGANTIAITKSWGWVDIDYIELEQYQFTPFTINPNPVIPQPAESAVKLYSFLRENFQQKTISGVMTSDMLMNTEDHPLLLSDQREVNYIYNSSGKMPALVGFDFLNSTGKEFSTGNPWHKSFTEASLSMAAELWEAGGIPVFCWHWRNPLHHDDEFYESESNFDLATAFTNSSCTEWNTGSESYLAIIRDIEIVSGLLKRLQDNGVAILWRPLHEASGGWFWWGRNKNATACKALYLLMFDRMVNHHGLHNLIWVWTSDGVDADWYPGDDYVDLIGRDFYYSPREKNHSSLIGEF